MHPRVHPDLVPEPDDFTVSRVIPSLGSHDLEMSELLVHFIVYENQRINLRLQKPLGKFITLEILPIFLSLFGPLFEVEWVVSYTCVLFYSVLIM